MPLGVEGEVQSKRGEEGREGKKKKTNNQIETCNIYFPLLK
jgi:hypothetical protein